MICTNRLTDAYAFGNVPYMSTAENTAADLNLFRKGGTWHIEVANDSGFNGLQSACGSVYMYVNLFADAPAGSVEHDGRRICAGCRKAHR